MRVNYQKLKATCIALAKEGRDATKELREGFESGYFTPQEFSLHELAESFLGRDFVRACAPSADGVVTIMEADAVNSDAFSNITGQIVYSSFLQAYESEAHVCTGLVKTIPTRLSGEKIAGISSLSDEGEIVGEGKPYPNVGVVEDYIETPETDKRGMIVPITKEAIFFDRTNLLLDRCSKVGESMGLNKEKRIAEMISGDATTFETGGKYKWKGTEHNVYQTSEASAPFYLNSITDVLTDYTDINVAEKCFMDMRDPITREPITIPIGGTLLVVPALKFVALRITNATETRSGDITAGTGIQTLNVRNVNPYQVVSSNIMAWQIDDSEADITHWFIGSFDRAFAYMENWPVTVVRAPVNSDLEFSKDIVVQFKVSERGSVAVIDPRYVVRSTGAG